jgi:hypothetical protein
LVKLSLIAAEEFIAYLVEARSFQLIARLFLIRARLSLTEYYQSIETITCTSGLLSLPIHLILFTNLDSEPFLT